MAHCGSREVLIVGGVGCNLRLQVPGTSVADLGLFWPPGSGIGFFRIPDHQAIFRRAWWQFLGKLYYLSLSMAQLYFLCLYKNKFQFCEIFGYKKGKTFVFPLPFCFLVVGSGIQNPGWIKIRDTHFGSATLLVTYIHHQTRHSFFSPPLILFNI